MVTNRVNDDWIVDDDGSVRSLSGAFPSMGKFWYFCSWGGGKNNVLFYITHIRYNVFLIFSMLRMDEKYLMTKWEMNQKGIGLPHQKVCLLLNILLYDKQITELPNYILNKMSL